MLKLDHLLYLNDMLHIFEIFYLSFQRAPDELRQSCVAMKPLDCDSRDLVWFLFEFPNTTGPRLNVEKIIRNCGYVLIAIWLRIWDQQTLLSILVSNEYHVRKNLNVSAIDYIIYYIFMCAQKFGILCCSDFHLLFDQAKIIMSLLAIQNPKTIIKRMSLCSEFSFLN